MKAKKIYLQPDEVVYMGMTELMDAQNGEEIFSDDTKRTLRIRVRMFGGGWELGFAAKRIGRGSCEVVLEAVAENLDEEVNDELQVLSDYVLRREYAMLDAMLLIGTPLETTYSSRGWPI